MASDGRTTTEEDGWGWVFVGLFLIVLLLYIFVIIPNSMASRECVNGGYVESRMFNGDRLCIGVIDGEPAVEWLEDVRERLGERR